MDKNKPQEIILFGFYATNDFNEHRDLHFLIIKKQIYDQGRANKIQQLAF